MSKKQQDNTLTQTTNRSVRSTSAEFNNRVTEVADLIMNGYTRTHIIKYGQKWKVCDRQLDDYIAGAKTVIKEINTSTLQETQAIVINGLWSLFRAARAEANIAEQHKILMSIAKLKGLEQVTINHIIEDKRELESLSDDELDDILEAEFRVN